MVSEKKVAKKVKIEEPINNIMSMFGFGTKGGFLSHNKSKENQDIYIIKTKLLDLDHCHFFAVCDGHGDVGI